jgi:hypothetical protein
MNTVVTKISVQHNKNSSSYEENIINTTKFVKNNHQTIRRTLYEIRRAMCETETGVKEKGVTKDHKVCSLRRTTRMHTMVTATVFLGRNPVNETLIASLKARLHWLIA